MHQVEKLKRKQYLNGACGSILFEIGQIMGVIMRWQLTFKARLLN